MVRSIRPTSLAARLFGPAGVEPRIAQVIPISCVDAVLPGTLCQEVPGGLDIGSPTGQLGSRIGFDRDGGGVDGIPDVQLVQLAIPGSERGHQFNTRFDFNYGANDLFAISTYFTRRNDLQTDVGNTAARPIGDLTFKPLNSAATFTWNHIFSST
ncbi:MAG TPA: hypothetical protein VLG74_09005, partial [Blastocatellia bacterium]|nr:hypothetical protein [Blastocatellia bacterium]